MARTKKTLRPLDLPRRMAPTDALFWYAESAVPSFRPLIGGLYLLEGSPGWAAIEASCDRALALVPRLRQRVVEVPGHLGLPEWIEDEHFDRPYHLRHVAVPEPGSLRDVLDLTATWLATPLDRERPLWEAYFVEGLAAGGSALFFKMHHSMVDGVGSVAILNALTQHGPDPEPPRLRRPRRRPGAKDGPRQQLVRLVQDQARESFDLARWSLGLPRFVLRHPGRAAHEALRTLRGLRGVVDDLSKPPVHDPLAASTSGLSRRLDVLQIPIERLRKIKAPLGVTLNDLVLAALCGALGRYYRERHVEMDHVNCMVPMNLRGRDERNRLGNRVGTFNIVLPVSESHPARRLERIETQTRAAKLDKRGAAAPFLVQVLTLIPGAAFGWMARRSLGRVNVACTNVPGVAEPRWIGTARIRAIHPFASVVEGTPLVVALLSYAGSMDVGIDTDPEAIPDPHRISELLEEALQEYETLASRAGGKS
jgi:diacylglycerol O-acyltransferase